MEANIKDKSSLDVILAGNPLPGPKATWISVAQLLFTLT